MSFKLFLLKAWKPAVLVAGGAYSAYGMHKWKETQRALHITKKTTTEEMTTLFKKIDVDGSGFIDEAELKVE